MRQVPGRIVAALFPNWSRRFLTFTWMTVLILLAFAWGVFIWRLIRQSASKHYEATSTGFWHSMAGSPGALASFNGVVLIGFIFVFVTRKNREYYLGRVLLYSVLLASLLNEVCYFALFSRH